MMIKKLFNYLKFTSEMKDMSQYVIKDLDKAFEEGYAAGKENISKIKELLK